MKLALNGALTVGTLDGANIEIRQHVGSDNIFIFGLDAQEVVERYRAGVAGHDAIGAFPVLEETINSLSSGLFSRGDNDRFRPIVDRVMGKDEFMVAADFEPYWHTQRRIDRLWTDQDIWQRMSLLNTARMSWFSSDRAIREYAEDIWHAPVDYAALTE